jgi:hypothetical protein
VCLPVFDTISSIQSDDDEDRPCKKYPYHEGVKMKLLLNTVCLIQWNLVDSEGLLNLSHGWISATV